MLSYETVKNAKLGKLKAALDDWKALPKKFSGIEEKYENTVLKPLKNVEFEGQTADAAWPKLQYAKSQITAAGAEADDVHRLLSSAYEKFHTAQSTLKKIAGEIHEANAGYQKTAGCDVYALDSAGKVTLALPSTDPNLKLYGREYGEAVSGLNERVHAALQDATDADEALYWALYQDPNGKKDLGFNKDAYNSIAGAEKGREKALKDAKKFLELAGKGSDMSNDELKQLNALAARHRDDPVFGQRIATTWGAKKTLEFWTEMADPYSAIPDKERVKLLTSFQENLSVSLASATHYPGEGMQKWEKDVIGLGDDQISTDKTRSGASGFQVMSNLMRYGEYDSKFLNNYGNALIKEDRKFDDDVPFWTNNAHTANLNFGDPNDRGRDPVNGFLQALGHNPDASADFFHVDKGDGDHINNNLKYLTQERHWHSDVTLEGYEGKVQGYNYLGRALESATTGHACDAYSTDTPAGDRFDTRTEANANVMKQVVDVYGNHPDVMHKQPGIGDNLGRMGGAWIDELDQGLSDYGNASEVAKESPDSVFGTRFEEQLFGRDDALKFLSTVGQSEAGHHQVSLAQQLYTTSLIDAHSPPIGSSHVSEHDLRDTLSAVRVGAEAHSVLDKSLVEQIGETYRHEDEERNKHMGKVTDWIKWTTGTAIGVGVGSVTGGMGGAMVVPVATETAGDALSTLIGQKIDDHADQHEVKRDDEFEEARTKVLLNGENAAARPGIAYWGDEDWNTEQHKDLQKFFEDAAKNGQNDAQKDPLHHPHEAD